MRIDVCFVCILSLIRSSFGGDVWKMLKLNDAAFDLSSGTVIDEVSCCYPLALFLGNSSFFPGPISPKNATYIKKCVVKWRS